MKFVDFFVLVSCFFLAFIIFLPLDSNAQETGEIKNEKLSPILIQSEMDKVELPGGFIYKNARNGVLGGMDIMDIPFTQFNYTEKTVRTFGDSSLPLNLVLINNPSIRTSNTSPMYSDFSIRGINANGNNFYLNGVPNLFAQFLTPPMHIIGNIDIMSGPNTVLNGSTTSVNGVNGHTAPNGVISVTTKRATAEPITRYTQTFSGRSSFGEYVDLSRRFGENKAWGFRVNAEHLDGDLAVAGMAREARNAYINIDHVGENNFTNFFIGYFDVHVTGGQRWFDVHNSSLSLVDAPDSSRSFDYKGMKKIQRGYMFTLNHDQKITDDWNVFINFGMTDRSGSKYDNNGGSLGLIGHTGIIEDELLNQIEANRNEYAQIGIKGKIKMGEVTNNLSLVWDWSWTKNYTTGSSVIGSSKSLTGSVFHGVTANDPLPVGGRAPLSNHEITKSITFADHLEYKNFGLIFALQRRENDFRSFNVSGAQTEKSNHLATTPSYAITFKPIDNLLIYASHSESYTRARTIGTQYANSGELVKPVKNKQNEIGLKYQNNDFITTLSLFSVDQKSFRVETINGRDYQFGDGINDYKGVELNFNGKLIPQFNLMGGVLYLNAKRKKTENGLYDGMYVQGVAKWSGVLAGEYEINSQNAAIARLVYSGPAYVTNGNKVKLPPWYSVDLGYRFEMTIHNVPITLRAMCYNLLDRDYWIGRGGSNVIGLSMPRTLSLSAQFDF
ncbi:MAG: TonB-dependent receptor [Deltaproteobacteria bacterium]|jgi:iron complex outermembrane receptor protein|nr:TonB-dependent receptor [Deltaproteobacteria bacterium]